MKKTIFYLVIFATLIIFGFWIASIWISGCSSALDEGTSTTTSLPPAITSSTSTSSSSSSTSFGPTTSSTTTTIFPLWSAVAEAGGEGVNGEVTCLELDPWGTLYAGGKFTAADGSNAFYIATWDLVLKGWFTLGSGLDDRCVALVSDAHGNIHAGGKFITAGGIPANCVAYWNGLVWSALGGGADGIISALCRDQGGSLSSNLYVGGVFSSLNGVAAAKVGKWNGAAWEPLGGGLQAKVNALVYDQAHNILYAGGNFVTAETDTIVNYVAAWKGSSWEALGEGFSNPVRALVYDDSNGILYAGGFCWGSGTIEVHFIAKWDGVSWSPLGNGFNDAVHALALDDHGNLYAGGTFTHEADNPANVFNGVAKWDGANWSAIGTGVGGGVNGVLSLAVDSSRGLLYIGGDFTSAGGDDSIKYIARYDLNQ